MTTEIADIRAGDVVAVTATVVSVDDDRLELQPLGFEVARDHRVWTVDPPHEVVLRAPEVNELVVWRGSEYLYLQHVPFTGVALLQLPAGDGDEPGSFAVARVNELRRAGGR